MAMIVPLAALVAVAAFAASTWAPPDGIEPGDLPPSWTTGASCPETPEFRTHAYNDDFFILRQSGCTNFEKPFLYLLFGQEKALLVDTGAQGADTAAAVQRARAAWTAKHGGRTLPLVVAHSHGHGDHVAGDGPLSALAESHVVAPTPEALQRFFHLERWPAATGSYDLGGRLIDIIPIPGHERASIAIYDRRTGILLTGDTLYPGRLYVRDAVEFVRSIERLVEFTRNTVVTHVLGAHIENARTPFVDYPEGTKYQADEHALELGRAHLLELHDALSQMNGLIVRRALRDFTIWPVNR
jgi:glyoxylase-like metal-dependent hydrolase (beta-lactamase superfamily II)